MILITILQDDEIFALQLSIYWTYSRSVKSITINTWSTKPTTKMGKNNGVEYYFMLFSERGIYSPKKVPNV